MSRARPSFTVGEGAPEPLGVTLTADGANVAVWSAEAEAIELCLFDAEGQDEIARLALPGRTGPVFHGFVVGLCEGARYGLRAHGPFEPGRGLRFNPNKLLIDPYAVRLDRPLKLEAAMFAAGAGTSADGDDGEAFDAADSGPVMAKAVIGALPEAAAARAPWIPWGRTVIYELHVRGFTRRHPDIPKALRGTFAGLAHPAAIAHLRRIGATTIELMPAAAWIDERHLPRLGLTNHWGYNPVAFMVPDPRLAPGGWAEVRAAVGALAEAGLETVLDVVFNHTGEGDARGPTLSLRGLDNRAYYRLQPERPAAYVNDAGTGNTLAVNRAAALRLTLDALRAWRRLGGVHGFRFDLAATLGRTAEGFDAAAPVLAAIAQDPELRDLKLIAEPWDIGPGGYRLGGFAPPFAEWNDRYRDTLRGFWRGDAVSLGELARRLAGSQDLFDGRRPHAGVNFVVAHDGFTLADLVAHRAKHNLANGEDGRDGTDHNLSWNHGVEGPTDDPAIAAARLADQRALLACLLVSRGTPMLTMGAELGHSQGGNNNAYAQDNQTSWIDWARADAGLAAFCARLTAIRGAHPALRVDRFLTGGPVDGAGAAPDVAWRTASGEPPTAAQWDDGGGETLVMTLTEPDGEAIDAVVVAVHRGAAAVEAILPEAADRCGWRLLADTADPAREGLAREDRITLAPRSVAILAQVDAPGRPSRAVSEETLGALAAAAGLAPRWTAIDGAQQQVSRQTRLALLQAMGLGAASERQAAESLHHLAERHDRRPLPFARVVAAGEAARLPLALADGAPPPRTWVTLTAEDGQVRRLRAAADAGSPAHARARDGRGGRVLWLDLPPLAPGLYQACREDAPDAPCRLIAAPAAAFTPPALAAGGRLWGLSVQLYAARRAGDGGVGDFTTLSALAARAAREGAAMLAINPLHALFADDRGRASPYAPSDRRFLEPLYLDLARTPGAERAAAAPPKPAGALIDYAAVWTAKARALEAAFAGDDGGARLDAFIAAGGEALERFAVFQAIAETRPGEPWRAWPQGLRDVAGAGVAAFADARRGRVRFHQYLQWLCEEQLASAAGAAKGLALGICRDLAIGAAPDGAELWAHAALAAPGVSIGAPPDPFSERGQVWGLPPYVPHRLAEDGWRLHQSLIAANLRHAGALRIDHVMGLARQFWVPDGAEAVEGAYVGLPLEDLLGVLALESVRAGAMIVGEDLGTVPDGLRERLWDKGLYSYRVLPFERRGDDYPPPGAWPVRAMACVTTHDLPPLAGWWAGADIDERAALGLIDAAGAKAARAERAADRAAIARALVDEALVVTAPAGEAPVSEALAAAIHRLVARSACALALAQVEDLAGEREAVNLPGTDTERPNWRRRLASPIETLMDRPGAQAILAALRAERPGRKPP